MKLTFWWWLSFVDNNRPKGDRFIGGLLIQAETFEQAIMRSWLMKCNPGGEVTGFEVPEEYLDRVALLEADGMTGRLLNKQETMSIDFRFPEGAT